MRLMRKVFLAMLWLASLYLAAISLTGCVERTGDTIITGTGTGSTGSSTGTDWTALTREANKTLADEQYRTCP